MRRAWNGLAASVILAVGIGMAVRADEDKEGKVPLDKVPKAVLKAVKTKFKDAKLVSAQTEKEDGKLVYEINLKHKDDTIEVTVTPDGKILSSERTIAAKDLPKAVAETVRSKYRGATIKKAEEVTEGDKTNYEVLLMTADKKQMEVLLDADGKVLKEEKEEQDEKKDKKE